MLPPSLLPSQPPSWGWGMGSRVSAESTLTGLPARGSFNVLVLQFLYTWGKKPHLLPCGSISSTLKRRGLALVPSLFRSSVVVNLHVSCPNSTSVLSSSYSWQILTWNCLQLEYSDNGWFKAGLHAKAVLTSLNTTFLPISRSRFKQR